MRGTFTNHTGQQSCLQVIFFLLLPFFLHTQAQAQPSEYMGLLMKKNPDVMYDLVYDNNISTIQFGKTGLLNSSPILLLGSNEQLSLQFDVIGSKNAQNYQFTIVHCDANWTQSNIFQTDYIDGLYQDYVTNYSVSLSTYQPYIHYRIDFPSANMRPKISGNYILKVYQNDPDRPVIQRRFYVFEQAVNVSASVQRANYARYRDAYQEIDFAVDTRDLTILNPYNDIKVVLKQDGRWDNEISNLKPLYIKDRTLTYNYEEGNLFPGINEFRYFDTRDFRFKGLGVRSYSFDSLYHAYLFTDEDRSINSWNSYIDQDGNYTVSTRLGQDASTEADYAWVHFKLRPSYRDATRDVYVFGALTNWQIDDRFKMKFDEKDQLFKLDAKLKQGYYDYWYAVVNDNGEIDPTLYEGSHWETENNYTVMVYYRQPSLATDRLVGIARVNTATSQH